MTCIVGYVDNKNRKLYLAGDSIAADVKHYHCSIRKDPKVFKRDKFLMGFTDSFRMGQLLMSDERFKVRKQKEKESNFNFMVNAFIPAVQELFDIGGYLKIKNEVFHGGNFLVGYNGELFEIQSNFQVATYNVHYAAVGAGEFYAMASLYTSDKFDLTAEEKITLALETAVNFSGYVRPPFVILSMKF